MRVEDERLSEGEDRPRQRAIANEEEHLEHRGGGGAPYLPRISPTSPLHLPYITWNIVAEAGQPQR